MKMEINRHELSLPFATFTIEFNVKNPKITIPDEVWAREWETGKFTNEYGDRCFKKIKSAIRSTTWWPEDWSFAGRSNGWFCIVCRGEESRLTETQCHKIEEIVEEFFRNYSKELSRYYSC